VKIFDCTEEVVDDELDMFDLKMDCALDNFLQVTFSKFENNVDGFEGVEMLRFKHIEELNNVRMLELL
jgi:hypothetical protein